jgi:hypothetical protein
MFRPQYRKNGTVFNRAYFKSKKVFYFGSHQKKQQQQQLIMTNLFCVSTIMMIPFSVTLYGSCRILMVAVKKDI